MSVQVVLKLGDIKGESIVDKHKEEIDVVSWSWGMTQTGSASTGSGGGSGAADVQDVIITKRVDCASPIIAGYCQTGSVIKGDAILTCIKVGGGDKPDKPNKVEYIKIKMSGIVMVSSVSHGQPETNNGKPTDLFLETISLHFSKIDFDYTTQDDKNTAKATIPSGTMSIGT
jgi:type VI secretion system secreted protein Hcp